MYDFGVWFLSFGKVFFKVHQPCNLYEHSILFNGSVIFCCMYIPLFVYPAASVDGRLGCVYLLSVANSAAVNNVCTHTV